MKYQRFTPTGCEDIRRRKFEFVTKTHFLYPINRKVALAKNVTCLYKYKYMYIRVYVYIYLYACMWTRYHGLDRRDKAEHTIGHMDIWIYNPWSLNSSWIDR